MAIIKNIENKTTSTNKPYKKCELEDGRTTSLWSDHPLFATAAQGTEIPDNLLYQKGQYWNVRNPARTGGSSGGYSSKRSADIKEAQNNKERSITFFNSTNAAITLVSHNKDSETLDDAEIQRQIRFWRDWFIQEHDNYKNHKERYPTDDPLKDDGAPAIDESMVPKDW